LLHQLGISANSVFFYLFATIILVSAILCVTARNAIHSAIYLIGTLLGVAGLYLHLNAEFLAGVQVILYVGGIMVLFLFVIMLVNIDQTLKEAIFSGQWKVGLAAVVLLGGELVWFISKGTGLPDQAPVHVSSGAAAGLGNVQQVGDVLFQSYLLPFEVASILLLVAMVGAVVMAKKRI
jgi:NADH-quinone oxidoreductase subunit J